VRSQRERRPPARGARARGAERRYRARGAVAANRDSVLAEVRALGVDVPDAQGIFVRLPDAGRAVELAAAFERRGGLTRPFNGDGSGSR
jgi:histidinol-phosphate/aromatic aminotransferase/cobyric acid decarboxylase-like protein